MKIHLNRLVILFIIVFSCMTYACKHTETMKDYVGVYYYKRILREYRILDYLILEKGGTYRHVYIDNNDTIKHEGNWRFFKCNDNSYRLDFCEWCWIKKENYPYKDEMISYYVPVFDFSSSLLSFSPDVNIDFWRIDSLEAIQLGIKEEGITW